METFWLITILLLWECYFNDYFLNQNFWGLGVSADCFERDRDLNSTRSRPRFPDSRPTLVSRQDQASRLPSLPKICTISIWNRCRSILWSWHMLFFYGSSVPIDKISLFPNFCGFWSCVGELHTFLLYHILSHRPLWCRHFSDYFAKCRL